ncbi:MAG: amidohydrolase family protein [Vitreoscilla sp.]|nr:amidohydrolase family protein [Polaromonas sp.]
MLSTSMPADVAPSWDCHVHVFDGSAKVVPGHYTPQHRPLSAIELLAQRHGFGHLVLVQPSVYGTDNTVLLDALRMQPGRHRGVAVVDVSISDAELTSMHSLGVRGVRFNLVSPAGNHQNPTEDFAKLAPRLRALGWHVQWYARADDLPAIAALHQSFPVPAVLDHLAGLNAHLAADHAAWYALHKLAALGAWVKLSGWYRLQADAPYIALDGNIARVAKLFASRIVWGSDWPHTSFAADALPTYASTLAPVTRVLPVAQKTDILNHAPKTLYPGKAANTDRAP